MEFDFEEFKGNAIDFFYKNKRNIFLGGSAFFALILIVGFFAKNSYDRQIVSSNMLIDYINGESDEFMKSNHKKGYALVKNIIESRKNPTIEKLDSFAKIDDYVFKNLFYFAKRLYFNYKDEYSSYYESEINPWSNLVITAGVFNGSRNVSLLKKKEEYMMIFAIGKGVKC